jgi:hypothetical protein
MLIAGADHPPIVLITAADERAAAGLADAFGELHCTVAGPFTDSGGALRWMAHHRPDIAVIDALIADDAALRLSVLLRQKDVRLVYFAAFDPATHSLRAEFPDRPGFCRDASPQDLLDSLQ